MPISAAATPLVQLTSSPIVFITLLTFSLQGYNPIRVCNNTVDVTSRGEVFSAYPFQITLPNDNSEQLPSVTLRIDNITGLLIEYLRRLEQPPTLLLEIVTNINFDVVEKAVGFLKLTQIGYNALEVTGQLILDNFLSRGFGSEYDPVQFPALFVV